MDFKIEVVVVPVSDVDRAKDFYTRIGFREDVDFSGPGGFRTRHSGRCALRC
ncbi:VOC family protein [Kitasatospora aureofaciens]|uniref:VOC family protein n=1 Tax=Kitasatospora aureofaciens TaxID=1894 RepID=UPI003F4D30A2